MNTKWGFICCIVTAITILSACTPDDDTDYSGESGEKKTEKSVFATFDKDEYIIDAKGGKLTMTFKSNMGEDDKLSVAYEQLDWVSFDTQDKTRAKTWNGEIRIIVEPNTSKERRRAMFELVKVKGDDTWEELDTTVVIQRGVSSGYTSTDYTHDGEVTQLQKHTIGHGIPVVLMGDGFADNAIADSTYWTVMNKAADNIFSEEPAMSMREYFDIYIVNAVSENDAIGEDYNTAFSSVPDMTSSYIEADADKISTYAEKVNRADSLNMLVVVVLNSNVQNGVTYLYSHRNMPSQFAVALCPIPNGLDSEEFREVLVHEAIGHGLAKLADEYGYEKNGEADEKTRKEIKQMHEHNWLLNVDTTSNVAKVKWWAFADNDNFASENISTYEGGYTYIRGLWKPTVNSMMNQNDCPFNAPSRKAIYDRIRYLGENAKTSTMDEFTLFDAVHKPQQWSYKTRASHTTKRRLARPRMIYK